MIGNVAEYVFSSEVVASLYPDVPATPEQIRKELKRFRPLSVVGGSTVSDIWAIAPWTAVPLKREGRTYSDVGVRVAFTATGGQKPCAVAAKGLFEDHPPYVGMR